MPNDPKFKTIARISKRPITLVISFYVHMLVEASKHKVRGTVDLSTEDIASALDVDEEEIKSVLDAMQGRLIDGNRLSGWEVRQPKREEGSEGGKAATDNYVYYLGTTDGYEVKVGFSRNPWSRLSDLQAGSAKKYELFAVMKTTTRSEFEIHKFFKSSRLNGEWFARSDALNLLIEKTKSKEVSSHDEAIDFLKSLDDSLFEPTTKNYRSESSATKEEDKDKDKDIKAIVVSLADHASDCPHQEIIKLYHEILPVLPPVKIWNKVRMAKLRQLWKEDKKRQSLDYWFRFFTYVSESDFLMGRTEKPFHGVNLEWLITQKNFTKIIERNYENRGAA